MLADDQLRMGLAKLQSIIKPTPYKSDNLCKDILVVGGGITGLTSALEGQKPDTKYTWLKLKKN